MIKTVGAAWDKKTKKGDDCISVSLKDVNGEKLNFYLYKNKQKKNDGQPDWNACVFEDDAPATTAEVPVTGSNTSQDTPATGGASPGW